VLDNSTNAASTSPSQTTGSNSSNGSSNGSGGSKGSSRTTGPKVPKGLESFYGQKVAWYDCVATAGVEKSADKTGFQCAKVKVPLDYSKPDGQTIEIAMKKHQATGSVRQGTLFMNPGGPGGLRGGQGGGDCSGSQPCQHGAAGEIVGGTHGTAP